MEKGKIDWRALKRAAIVVVLALVVSSILVALCYLGLEILVSRKGLVVPGVIVTLLPVIITVGVMEYICEL